MDGSRTAVQRLGNLRVGPAAIACSTGSSEGSLHGMDSRCWRSRGCLRSRLTRQRRVTGLPKNGPRGSHAPRCMARRSGGRRPAPPWPTRGAARVHPRLGKRRADRPQYRRAARHLERPLARLHSVRPSVGPSQEPCGQGQHLHAPPASPRSRPDLAGHPHRGEAMGRSRAPARGDTPSSPACACRREAEQWARRPSCGPARRAHGGRGVGLHP
jgi:hypothetical protein